jgi:uncharacterized protein YndB with AHSA1/START domain
MTDSIPEPAPGEGFTVVRTFDAPRQDVWREWTTPEAFADWYGGTAAQVPVETVEMDVRPGGSWRATMHAGRGTIEWRGEYLEVVEPERLVFTVTDQPGDVYDQCVVELSELDDGRTEMRFTQTGGHMPPEGYERAKQGWGGFWDRMAERLRS